MPSSISFAQSSGGGSILMPVRNGFANRIIFRNPGAVSFTLPAWAQAAKLVIIGGGGGGALQHMGTNTPPAYSQGGGAGGGFSSKLLTGVAGLTLTGTIGAGGLGGRVINPNQANNAIVAGSNGGTTTVTLGGVTLSATGGAGAPGNSGAVYTPPSGGLGVGGDINTSGGLGGSVPSTGATTSSYDAQSYVAASGGGASGSPNGKGGDGGRVLTTGNNSVFPTPAAGGGWGGPGGDSTQLSTSGDAFMAGAGSMGAGFNTTGLTSYNSVFGGRGRYGTTFIASEANSNPMKIIVPQELAWWDVDEIGGWGGSYFAQPFMALNRRLQGIKASDGQDGAGGSNWTQTNSTSYGSAGGFGGGGAGCRMKQNIPASDDTGYGINGRISPAPGGIGGGGGGFQLYYASNGFTEVRSSDGGDGCIILYF